MPAAIQLLLNPSSTATAIKPSKVSTDSASDSFKTELTRASDRQAKDTTKTDDSDKTSDARKSDKPEPSKKNHAKGKAKKSQTGEKSTDESTDETDAAAKAKKPVQPAAPVDPTADDTAAEAVPVDPTKPEGEKDKPVDPTAAAAALAIQPQAKAAAPNQSTEDNKSDQPITADQMPVVAKAVTAVAQATEAKTTADATAAEESTDTATAAQAAAGQKADAGVAALGDDSELAIPAKTPGALKKVSAAAQQVADDAADEAQAIAQYINDLITKAGGADPKDSKASSDDEKASLADITAAAAAAKTTTGTTTTAVAKPEAPAPTPQTQFADANHPEIVKGIATQLLPHGGTMQLRLDPPELGALQVTLSMKDGVMNATFQTSNEDATRMLSHSMTQLKTAMESAGISVDKLQVQHTPRDSQAHSGNDDQSRGQPGQEDMRRQQEQQRKDMIKRMWRKLAGENDPLDMVA